MVEDTATQDEMVELNKPGSDAAADAPVLDAAAMAELRALDPDGQAQLVKRVLATYQASLVRLVDQFAQARQQGAWEQVSRVAHTLKSSSASIGARGLSAVCADIERLLRDGDQAAALPLIGRFEAEVAITGSAVRRELEHIEAAGS